LIENGVSGFLVPVNDSEALARRLGELLAQPQLRSDIGKNARKRVEERFSVAQVLPAMVAAYEHAVSNNQARSQAAPTNS
jgi:glycosyltransferase involved in cell wall biosynthesis